MFFLTRAALANATLNLVHSLKYIFLKFRPHIEYDFLLNVSFQMVRNSP